MIMPVKDGPSAPPGNDLGSYALKLWEERLLGVLEQPYLMSLAAIWRYGLATTIIAAATALRVALIPWLSPIAPYNLTFLAEILVMLLLGSGPGFLAVFLGNAAVEVFIVQQTTFFPHKRCRASSR